MKNLLERMKPEFSELLNVKSDTNLDRHKMVIECLVFNYFSTRITVSELIDLNQFTHPHSPISIYQYITMFNDD